MKKHKWNQSAVQNSTVNEKGTYFTEFLKNTHDKVNYFDSQSFNIWNYLKVEMFGIGEPGHLEPPNQEDITNFFLVPMNLESFLLLGVSICIDAFLYVITYLPIRVVFSTYLLIIELQKSLLPNIFFPASKDHNTVVKDFRFHRTHFYDLMRGVMFVVGCIALRYINMSQVYHFIRGQGMIKLYVLTAMLEVFDRLLSTFGQDAFDSMHRHTRFNPKSIQMFLTFLMVTVYVCLHSIVYFMHVATITVVINSVDTTLITVLILNNFKEIRSFVMKKFDCHNLFQLACSDVVERFQMFLFLFLILIVQLAQAGISMWWDTFIAFCKIAGMMLLSECLADWIKHAFINKFNGINASVYQDFAYVLRNDILSNQKDEIILDHTYSVTRRLGLSQIPLGCVCVRYLYLALATPYVQIYISQQTQLGLVLQSVMFFTGLVALKIMIGVGLVFYSAAAHKRDAQIFSRTPAAVVVDHSNTHLKIKPEPTPIAVTVQQSSMVTKNSNSDLNNYGCTASNNHSESLPSNLRRYRHPSIDLVGVETSLNHITPMQANTNLGGSVGVKSRNNSISNPFAEMHVVTEDISKVLAAPTITKQSMTIITDQDETLTGIALTSSSSSTLSSIQKEIHASAATPLNSPNRPPRRSVSTIEPVTITKVMFNQNNDNLCTNFNSEFTQATIASNENINANLLTILERTKSEEIEATRMIERLDFMESLSSIERYTVHNGRVV